MRAESITASMVIAEQKTWDALKSRLLEFAREDARLKKMNKASAALYLDDHSKDNKGKQGGHEKPSYKTQSKPSYQKDTPTCIFFHNEGHTEEFAGRRRLTRRQVQRQGNQNTRSQHTRWGVQTYLPW